MAQIPVSLLKAQVAVADGTAAAPSISFSNDTNTGLYRSAADAVGVVTGGVERIRVGSDGNVGIGSTNPQDVLDVNGAIRCANGYKVTGSTVIDASQNFYGTRGVAATLQSTLGSMLSTDYNFILYATNDVPNTAGRASMFVNGTGRTEDGGVNCLTFRNDGGPFRLGSMSFVTTIEGSTISLNSKVGIGTTNVVAGRFEVNGTGTTNALSALIRGGTGNFAHTDWPNTGWSGGLGIQDLTCGGIYYNTLVQRSDVRKKKDITTFSKGLDVIKDLRPVTFKWKDSTMNDDLQYGFIAQEVESVIPEIIGEDTSGFKYIRDAFIPILVNSINTLRAEVNQLKSELALMKE